MDLRTLRYFVYIAEARSFSQASVHLRIAQPALSRQIAKLEGELGLPLFIRTGRKLELTEAGQQLLVRAHSLLRQASTTLEEVRTYGSELRGTIAVGISPATCEVVAPLLLRDCAQLYPDLKLRFVEGFSSLVLEQLLNQEITLAILHNPAEHKALEVRPLFTEAMYLVGPPTGEDGLPPASADMALESLPMILPNQAHGLRLLIEDALNVRSLNVAIQVDGLVTTKALVEAGLGYTILPYSAIHQSVRHQQLSAIHLENVHIPWTMCMVSRVEQRSGRPVQAMYDIIQANMSALLGTSA